MSEASKVILAIESSCDDTSAAVLIDGIVKTNYIATQKIHEQYGGVVPEMASRAHLQHIVPVVETALKDAGVRKQDITSVAFTQAPGLIGSLLVGASFAKGMAQALNVPLIAVNHMQGHVLAHWIEDPKPLFPFLNLTVSGGHTQIVLVRDYLDMEVIGHTIDDAAGEAFDKVAKMLGIPYPGGPVIDKLAASGNPHAYVFPIPEVGGFNFSFSGIKTSVLYFLQKELRKNPDFIQENKADICASVQYTIIKSLMNKFEKAAQQYEITQVGIGGGVSANSGLRSALQELAAKHGWQAFLPKFQYCTDNAAMIGITGYYKARARQFSDLSIVPDARANW